MKAIPESIQIKLEHSQELHDKIFATCFEQVKLPEERNLRKIGAYVGDLANNMRSALNFAMRDFADSHLQDLINPRTNVDFPSITTNESDLRKNIRVMQPIADHFPQVYKFLELSQPYHKGNDWLSNIIHVSNIDKHITINQVVHSNIHQIGTSVKSPVRYHLIPGRIMKHIIATNTLICYETPNYIGRYMLFVSNEGKWVSFRVPLKENIKLDVMRFATLTPPQVKQLVTDFYNLM